LLLLWLPCDNKVQLVLFFKSLTKQLLLRKVHMTILVTKIIKICPHFVELLPPPKRLRFTGRLSVCLLATSRKNYQWDLHEIFIRDASMNKEELGKFCKSSTCGSGSGNFVGFFNIAK